MRGAAKELQEVVRRAKRQGFVVEWSKGRHIRFLPPDSDQAPYFAAGTPSDYRAVHNIIAALRRRGYHHERKPR